jgi:glycosyltransferase involved in cell wall biosynthesis
MTGSSPLVSFCMSTYKRPELLHKQLSTILLQEYNNFEIIVSDNDPEASAKSVVENVNDRRVLYFHNEVNLGMIKSFNKSIERSNGEYIVMITDDDPTYPGFLTTLIDLAEKYPGYGVYSGCGDLIIENEFAAKTMREAIGKKSTLLKSLKPEEVKIISENDFASAYLDGFFSTTFLLWSCMMVRKDVLLSIKGVPDYGSELLGDHAYVIANGSVKGMIFTNKAVGGQVIHGNNFGYDFLKLKDKYVNTPIWFYGYLKSQLSLKKDWSIIEKKIRNFIGRNWVEYSLLIFKGLNNRFERKEFYKAFHTTFSNTLIHKWKYKFYLKCYCKPLFDVLLKIKGLWT